MADRAKRSKTVDGKVRTAWSILAGLAFEQAKLQVKAGALLGAEETMGHFEDWVDQAGFEAMRYRIFY